MESGEPELDGDLGSGLDDSAADEVLASLEGDAGVDSDGGFDGPEDEHTAGDDAPSAGEAPGGDDGDDDAEDGDDRAPKGTKSKSAPEWYEAALTAARYAKIPRAAFDAMSEAEQKAFGEASAARTRDLEEARASKQDLEKRLSETTSASDRKATDDADLEKLLSNLRDTLGDEAATSMDSVLRARDEARDSELQELRDAVTTMAARQIREELSEEFPSITDEGSFKEVVKKARGLLASGEYDLGSAMADAAKIVFFGESQVVSPKNRRRGQPTAPTRRAGKTTVSKDQISDQTLAALERKHKLS